MRLGVISDSHVISIDEIPVVVRKALANVDLIVHAGDITHRAVLEGLKSITRVRAVCGNMDSLELISMLPEKDIFEVSGRKIGVIHGSGAPLGITTRVRSQFANVDIIIFGHSHEACNRYIEGVLLFNPGPVKSSFGLLSIADTIDAQIVRI